ncbi:hypothetical protein RO07_25610 [Pandoraea pulmonicola]|uniref:Uncharacterized protein n=2 Tax=Pandoraea pulmonicola TaxID=93221 RepID=A0AAJ5D1W6_PANPU|nr:hypothetical protein RO07_25610 [Pandoraea pulmonicola]SUA92122.1 Uncharacterised protein [Pandoraea pulmonicola]
MIKFTPETRMKLQSIGGFAVLGAAVTGVVVGKTDLPYDPRDVGAIVFAAVSALWLFRRR